MVNAASVAAVIAVRTGEAPVRVWTQSSAVMDRTGALTHLAQLGFGLLAALVVVAQPLAAGLLLLPAAAM